MDLFNDMKLDLIEKPTTKWFYQKVKKEKEVKSDKELRKELRATMTKEEYHRYDNKLWYQKNKKFILDKEEQRRRKEDQEAYEWFMEMFKPYEYPKTARDIDEEFNAKYIEDWGDYREGRWRLDSWWRYTRLWKVDRKLIPTIRDPIKIIRNQELDRVFNTKISNQQRAYEYILPYIDEISFDSCWLPREQKILSKPQWRCKWKLLELCQATDIPQFWIIEVFRALKEGVYINSLPYLWETSFLIGDRIMTSTGNLYIPSLSNNFNYLNLKTCDDIHKETEEYFRRNNTSRPPVWRIMNWYLLRIKNNKFWENWEECLNRKYEYDYYVVWMRGHWAMKKESRYVYLTKNPIFYMKKHK